MDIKHLKTFAAVARSGSFSQAAQTLGYAQPTVSTHINLLEKSFNVRLFERLGHRNVLTNEGSRLLGYVNSILKMSDEAVEALAVPSADGVMSGRIAVGANESFSVVRLPAVIKSFLQNYPGVHITLKFGSVRGIYEQLQNNTVDVAFFLTREVSYPDLVIEKLIPESVVLVAAPGYPLPENSGGCGIELLDNTELIITQENCTYRAMIDEMLKTAHIRPRSIIETNNVQAIKQLVMSGLGMTILPRVAVEYEIRQHMLAEIPWQAPILPVYTQIAYHKNKWLSPPLVRFMEETRLIITEQSFEGG